MRVSCLAVLLALSLPPTGVLRAEVVENAVLRLEVSDENGAIVSLYDKRNRTEYVADRKLARLFELLIPDASNYSRRIVSWKQRPASVRRSGEQIEIRFASLKPDEEQYSFGSGLVHLTQLKGGEVFFYSNVGSLTELNFDAIQKWQTDNPGMSVHLPPRIIRTRR